MTAQVEQVTVGLPAGVIAPPAPRRQLRDVHQRAARLAHEAATGTWQLVRRADMAWAYAVILVGVTIVLSILGSATYRHVVDLSSTNLANLRETPATVLISSAFVVSTPWGLWIVPFLVVVYAAAQRYIGRFATVIVALFGHVGATLVVATGLAAGIANGRVARQLVVHETDVGVSYALVCLAAFITPYVPRRYRWVYASLLVAYVVVPLALRPSFTGFGHLAALTIGASLALVACKVGTFRAGAAREQISAPK